MLVSVIEETEKKNERRRRWLEVDSLMKVN